MSNSNRPSSQGSKSNRTPAADEMAEIRRLIVGPEQSQIARLQRQLDNLDLHVETLHAENLSKVLPEAIILRSQQDQKLTNALAPIVDGTIRGSVRSDPQPFAEAIAPAMMPAIRRAISHALTRMIQSLNQALEHSFSVQSLKWRIEALRTGKPFAEIVLLHTLRYRVEQVFLIHRETGLLLQHVVAGGKAVPDADIISGMLTAIRDFVQDSFGVKTEETLETLQIGELAIWIEQGPQAVLAGVIRGNAPQELRGVFQGALEKIHREQQDALESFHGDTARFEESRRDLEACLLMQLEPSERRLSPLLWGVPGILLLCLGIWLFFAIREHRRWSDYLSRLDAEEGIVVTKVENHHGKYFISGLRDPLATSPTTVLKQTKLLPEKVIGQWESYQALSPKFILMRARSALQPPDTVTLTIDKEILSAVGSAPHGWIVETRKQVRFIAGVTQFLDAALVDLDVKALASHIEKIEKQVLHFGVGTTQFVSGQEEVLQNLATEIQELFDLAQTVGMTVRLEIRGHSSSEGPEKINLKLREERANQVLSTLASKGLSTANMVAVDADEPLREEVTAQDRAFNRGVSFNVIRTDSSLQP